MATTDQSAPDRADQRLRGVVLRLGSVSSFAVMGLALKLASTHGADLAWLMFGRSACAMPLVLLWLALGPGLHTIRTKRPMAHITRSTLGTCGMVAVIQALVMLPISDATTITFTAPIFATILSAIVLGEKVGPNRWAAVAIGFVGVLVVARPFAGGSIPLAGMAVALAAAVFSASVAVTVRQIGRTENVGATVFWFMAATGTVGMLALPFGQLPTGPLAWPFLALAGIGGGAGQICMTASLRNAPVSVLAPFDYLQIPLAMLFGWGIWGNVPTLPMVLGALLIAAGGLWTAWREQRLRRETIAATPPEV